jgi:hypothetical protein
MDHIGGDHRIELYFRVVGLIGCFGALSEQIGAQDITQHRQLKWLV